MKSYLAILKIALHGRSAGKILLATIFSFTFSIAVILCTFGLMDGFDHLLKSGLRHSSGDILITNRKGFFELSPALQNEISVVKPLAVAPVIQTEAFALHGGVSKGVMVRGIEDKNFSDATGLSVTVPSGTVVIGEELAKQMKAKPGSSIALTFGRGNESGAALPLIQLFEVSGIVKHGIYQKDLRFVYLNRGDLAELMELGDKINLVILATEETNKPLESLDPIRQDQLTLKSKLDMDYVVRPFWNEYDFLIEAVKVEKFSISLILQLIVVVAIFNIIAFVIYIMEKKAQEFFFLRAVGLSLKSITQFWFCSVIVIWSVSCIGAHLLSMLFNWCLQNLTFLQIPGEIYVLSSLNIRLDFMAYVTVYGVSLMWILLAALIGYFRLKKRPIMQGLRQEFSS
jgi:ABC-type lipoprotein release transport system permease subunit